MNRVSKDSIVNRAPLLVTGLATVWIAFEAANLTWLILDDGSSYGWQEGEAVVLVPQRESGTPYRLTDITQYHLFGEQRLNVSRAAPQAREVVNAPKTRLNLALRGIFALENGAFALISIGTAEEQVYRVGMKLNPSTTIEAIHKDSVALNRAGKLELLYFDDEGLSESGESSRQPLNRFSARPPAVGGGDTKFAQQRDRLLKNPQEAMRFARIQPVMQQGKMTGYRVNPGSDPQLFDELGFKAGDLVKEVNGVAVDDPTRIGEVMNLLTSAKQLSVTIERRGRIENLQIEF